MFKQIKKQQSKNIHAKSKDPEIVGKSLVRKKITATQQIPVQIDAKKIFKMHPLFNLWSKCIIVYDPHSKSVIAIDQHAAHERIRYEFFLNELELRISPLSLKKCKFDENTINLSKRNQTMSLPNLMTLGMTETPLQEEYSQDEIQLIVQNKIYLVEVWKFKFTEDFRYIIQYPVIFSEPLNQKKFIMNIVTSFMEKIKIPPLIDQIIMSKSCKSAIKFGEDLTFQQSHAILQNLSKCAFPFHCVHGRNSMQPIFNIATDEVFQI